MSKLAALLASLLSLTTLARADAPDALRADAEIDPSAFALGGYSLHVGVGGGHVRADLGAFALDLPTFMHGNDGFTASFHGYGAKLQAFLSPDQTGGFAGVAAALLDWTITRDGSSAYATDTELSVDIHAGWRFALPAQLYATLWLAVGTAIARDDVMLDGTAFERATVTVFPAIHVGYRFR